MNNQVFQTRGRRWKSKKLDVVLHRSAGAQLTEAQRKLIARAVGHHKQYHMRLCRSLTRFQRTLSRYESGAVVQLIFGCEENNVNLPAAALIHKEENGCASRTLYIYLPEKEGDIQDGA